MDVLNYNRCGYDEDKYYKTLYIQYGMSITLIIDAMTKLYLNNLTFDIFY
jgi:hypothetical protein